MAAATSAAIASIVASMMAIRGPSLETQAPLDGAGRFSAPAPRDASPGGTAPAAVDHEPTRSDGGADSALTSDSVEEVLAEAPHERRDLVLSELLARLVSHDAAAAARIAEREAVGYTREVALRVVAQSWTKRDAVAALNWVASLSDPQERDTALENAALELAVYRPQLALQALGRRSVPRSPDSTLEGVVQQWATTDFAAAHAWAEAHPAGRGRDALMTRLVFVRAGQDPADAARIASTAFAADARRIDALSTIVYLWGAQDPAAARDLALTLDAKAQQRVRAELALLD
jgi:hypothetical protein